jgi:voltage-gated sodium channel
MAPQHDDQPSFYKDANKEIKVVPQDSSSEGSTDGGDKRRSTLKDDDEINKHLDRAFGSALAAKGNDSKSAQRKRSEQLRVRFDMAVGVVILTNAGFIALETDADPDNADMQQFLGYAEIIFCVLFSVELLVRLKIDGLNYFRDPANWLDFFLVISSDIDVFILRNMEGADDTEGMKIMSILRMLRLLRLARLLRVFRMFKELWLIVAGLAAALRTLFWASLFLFLMIFMFAIFATQMIGHATNSNGDNRYEGIFEDPVSRLFGKVPKSMMTLFICITDGCVESVIRPMSEANPWFTIYWMVYIFVTMLGLLNLIIGIFCENACTTAAANEDNILERLDEHKSRVLNNMKVAFLEMDEDGSGEIDKDEYYHAINHNKKVQDALKILGLDNEDGLFDKIDADKSGAVSFDEFMEGATLIMKGNEPAKGKDMVGTYLSVQAVSKNVQRLREGQADIMEALEELRTAAKAMTGSASFPVADAAPVIKNRSPSKDSIFEGGQRSSLKPGGLGALTNR